MKKSRLKVIKEYWDKALTTLSIVVIALVIIYVIARILDLFYFKGYQSLLNLTNSFYSSSIIKSILCYRI